MLNKTFHMGRLTRDPELRYTQTQIPVANFSIAVDRPGKSKQSEKVTDFFDVVAWRNTAEFAAKYLSKGRMVVVEGMLTNRTWQDNEGKNNKITEIVAENIYFADSAKPAEQKQAAYAGENQGAYVAGNQAFAPMPEAPEAPQPQGRFRMKDSGSDSDQDFYGGFQPIAVSDEELPF